LAYINIAFIIYLVKELILKNHHKHSIYFYKTSHLDTFIISQASSLGKVIQADPSSSFIKTNNSI